MTSSSLIFIAFLIVAILIIIYMLTKKESFVTQAECDSMIKQGIPLTTIYKYYYVFHIFYKTFLL
jgi:hypothetical protein